MIDAPGIYEIPAAEYHRDPCPAPSLSASVAHLLVDRSPAHARHAHPRLNPALAPDEPSTEQDIGSAVHALMLGDGAPLRIVAADDWRTKLAREARAEARAQGEIPLLTEQARAVHALVREARAALARTEIGDVFARPGRPEQTLIWREGDVWCRARPDWLPDDASAIYDLKTTSGSANPETWGQRALYDLGAHLQAAFYSRGYEAVTGRAPPPFRFIVVEMDPPHGLAIVQLDPAALALATEQVGDAITTWRRCLATGEWPGYPARICHVEPPAWQLYRHQGRALRREQDRDLASAEKRQRAMEMQAP